MKFVYKNICNSIVSLVLTMFVSYGAYADDCESLNDSVPHSCNACLTYNSCVMESVFQYSELHGEHDAIINACLEHIEGFYTGMNVGADWVDRLINEDAYVFYSTVAYEGKNMHNTVIEHGGLFTPDELAIIYGDNVRSLLRTNIDLCISAGYCGFDTCIDRYGASYTAVPDLGQGRTAYVSTSSGGYYQIGVERFGAHVKCCKCPDDGTYDIFAGEFGDNAFGYIGCIKETEEPFSDTTGSGVNSGQCYYSLTSEDFINGLF